MKTHLNLATRDLDASVAFYRTLLLAEPAKRYADYALFVTDEPGLELALDLDPTTNVREGAHYGVVVENGEDVAAAIVRFRKAGYPVEIETDETCCYAVQKKVWTTDPDGRRWETYFVVAESEERDKEASPACC
jgi:catechol 2,3-dioxygenase-like lactoylglutathione lyase family enzyme